MSYFLLLSYTIYGSTIIDNFEETGEFSMTRAIYFYRSDVTTKWFLVVLAFNVLLHLDGVEDFFGGLGSRATVSARSLGICASGVWVLPVPGEENFFGSVLVCGLSCGGTIEFTAGHDVSFLTPSFAFLRSFSFAFSLAPWGSVLRGESSGLSPPSAV